MEKTVKKVTLNEKQTYTNKFNKTVYYFNIEFTDGNKGFFTTLKKDQDKFVEGTTVNVTSEVIEKGEYKFYKYDILKVNNEKPVTQKQELPNIKSQENQNKLTYVWALHTALDYSTHLNIDIEEIHLTKNEFIKIANSPKFDSQQTARSFIGVTFSILKSLGIHFDLSTLEKKSIELYNDFLNNYNDKTEKGTDDNINNLPF